ncbi:MAG: DNA-3-methyladenine glycosylase [Bacteroidota bacterium]
MRKLNESFYQRKNVLTIAKELIGKILVTNWEGIITSGRIVECEAYNGIIDKASHAAGGRRTARNEIMYGAGGFSYVYLCYGIHHLFNVVTNLEDTPHAILVRAVEPIEGVGEMLLRTGKKKPDYTLTRGPGNVSKALGIFTKHSGIFLSDDKMYIADDGKKYKKSEIIASPRIGVDYAGEDAKLLYRFYVKDSPYVSGKKI